MTSAPLAAKRDHEISVHGKTWNDPWFWIREKEDSEVIKYLEAENNYTETFMKPLEGLREKLYQELRGRIKEDDSSVPVKDGDYYYYRRFEENGQYPIFCRKFKSLESEEEIYLDVNELAQGKDYLRLGVCDVSPNHEWLAYSTDENGSEKYTITIKNLKTEEILPERIQETAYSLEWANDNQTFFYSKLDENERPKSIYRHTLNTKVSDDVLIYEEQDARFFAGLAKSETEKYIFITLHGNNMNEWLVLPADTPTEEFTMIQAREKDLEYDIVHHNDVFFIRNNADGAKDFQVSVAPVASPQKEHWKPFLPYQAGTLIDGIDGYKDHLVITQRENGLTGIKIYKHSTKESHLIEFKDEPYSVFAMGSAQWDTTNLRFTYTSMITPASIYDYDLDTRERELKKQKEIPSGYEASHYETRRIFATAKDGTKIPISIYYKKDTPLDGSAPLFLYGYGSYGLSLDIGFNTNSLSLVDRGFIYAIVHVRGGMEMGWDWYENGKLLKKKNTFFDFIAGAQHLISKKYTSKKNIIAAGGSAGGMLMGVIANERPDLFKAIIADVPFVDVINTMLDESLPLTTAEYNEWGNPGADKEAFDYMMSYSPYDNVKKQDYPSMFILGGLNDPRVTYWEPAKWTAKLRDLKTDSNTMLLKINMGAGHGGSSGRFEYLKEPAMKYAFILKTFGKD